jgi:hypothetical protein
MSDEQQMLTQALAAEDVTRRNIQAGIDYSKETRLLVRELSDRVEFLVREVATLRGLNETQNAQIGFLRSQVLGGGRTVPDATDR